jgi:hypothetical protein
MIAVLGIALAMVEIPGSNAADERDLIGQWTINANNSLGKLELWKSGNNWYGRVSFYPNQHWEDLTNIAFDPNTLVLRYARAAQQYTGRLAFDELVGTFIDSGQNYTWRAQRAWSHLVKIESAKPSVKFVSTRSASPTAPKVLALIEERLLGRLLGTVSDGSSVLQRYLDDLQKEGWESYAYGYDVRSDETGEQNHRHLPSEVLQLYKYIRKFYEASDGLLSV